MGSSRWLQVVCCLAFLILVIETDITSSVSLRRSRVGSSWQSQSDQEISYDNATPNDRRSRFLNFLFVVRFPNDRCNASNGLAGTCYTAAQCSQRGGAASGTCARNYGVCCTFVLQTCGNASSENCTYFQNPGFPSTYDQAQTCSIFISRKDNNICQFRFDFLTFDIQPPVSGTCTADRFTVSGQSGNSIFPPLCGLNTGQSAYADVSSSQGPIIISLTTGGTFARSWNIKVTQIRCDDPNRAPANCLQYFTGASGTLKSFNYETTAPATAVGYLNNLRYAICIRKEMGFCDISFTNLDTSTFGIDTTGPNAGEAGLGEVECVNDFLRLVDLRFCGDRLNPNPANPTTNAIVPVTTAGPFVVEFSSNADTVRRGFMISYTQTACI